MLVISTTRNQITHPFKAAESLTAFRIQQMLTLVRSIEIVVVFPSQVLL